MKTEQSVPKRRHIKLGIEMAKSGWSCNGEEQNKDTRKGVKVKVKQALRVPGS